MHRKESKGTYQNQNWLSVGSEVADYCVFLFLMFISNSFFSCFTIIMDLFIFFCIIIQKKKTKCSSQLAAVGAWGTHALFRITSPSPDLTFFCCWCHLGSKPHSPISPTNSSSETQMLGTGWRCCQLGSKEHRGRNECQLGHQPAPGKEGNQGDGVFSCDTALWGPWSVGRPRSEARQGSDSLTSWSRCSLTPFPVNLRSGGR